MSGHDPRFDRWDASYVLGALSAEDRRDYEDHLSDCERCRAEVAELGGLPGLLSRVPAGAALRTLAPSADPDGDIGSDATGQAVTSLLHAREAANREPAALEPADLGPADLEPASSWPALRPAPEPPADLVERLQRGGRRRRVRRALTTVGVGLAAAAVAVAAVLGVQSLARPVTVNRAPTVTAELVPTAAVGQDDELSASVRLYAKAWGTEIETECRHRQAGTARTGAQPGGGISAGPTDSPSSPGSTNPTSSPHSSDSTEDGYALYLVEADGRTSQLSSWDGIERSPIETTTATATRIDQMRWLQVRSLHDGTVLLTGRLPG